MASNPTRRSVGFAALLAPLGAVAAASSVSDGASPRIRQLWSELVTARTKSLAFEASPHPRREDFVARWGEIPRGSSAVEHWGNDPDQPALAEAVKESNRLGSVECDALEALLDYPARSPADVAYKLAAVLDVWRATETENEHHERVAMQLMEDAERVLYDLLPAVRLPVA